MTALNDLVQGLVERPGVTSASVVSPDGLSIHHAGPMADSEALAALTVTLVRDAARLADASGSGALTRVVLECGGGLALLGVVRGGNWLLVLTRPDADIGQLLYDLRQEGPALAAQL
jgi:predicted regulator of Ras-like GTPase activity (Roadblock/LC7/MglB family)